MKLIGVNARRYGNGRFARRTFKCLGGTNMGFGNGVRKRSLFQKSVSITIYSNFIKGVVLGAARSITVTVSR